MDIPKRLWDANVTLAYLSGDPIVYPDCGLIIEQANAGKLIIAVSAISEAEVAFLPAYVSHDSELLVSEFFTRPYVKTYNYDVVVAREARRLIRTYKPGLKPNDAIHMATALLFEIPILETIDDKLLHLNGKEGNPPLIIRKPKYEGPVPFPSISPLPPSPLQNTKTTLTRLLDLKG